MSRYPTRTVERTRKMVRCMKCNKLLAEVVTVPWCITCPRCKSCNAGKLDGTLRVEAPRP